MQSPWSPLQLSSSVESGKLAAKTEKEPKDPHLMKHSLWCYVSTKISQNLHLAWSLNQIMRLLMHFPQLIKGQAFHLNRKFARISPSLVDLPCGKCSSVVRHFHTLDPVHIFPLQQLKDHFWAVCFLTDETFRAVLGVRIKKSWHNREGNWADLTLIKCFYAPELSTHFCVNSVFLGIGKALITWYPIQSCFKLC